MKKRLINSQLNNYQCYLMYLRQCRSLAENVFKFNDDKNPKKVKELYHKVEELSQKLIRAKRKVVKGVSANIDFYSGFVYNMLGLPVELFTPMFAIARMSGWCAHRLEELLNNGKIIRPAYVSMNGRNPYVKLDDRK